MNTTFDLAIIGGGVNGCGIARDAAGRGCSVFLCEQGDLASGTSSASTKLIHGGMQYLEHFEFRLAREALRERETLWAIAPHIVRPLRFVLPYRQGLKTIWDLRARLFLSDIIGGRKRLPPTRGVDLDTDEAGRALRQGAFRRAFEFSDCWVDDARLVVLNARDAADRGATVRTRTRAVAAERGPDGWTLTVEDMATGEQQEVRAGTLVNAAGPWVGKVLATALPRHPQPRIRLVQGSHVIVPKLFDHDRCYIFQNADGRIFFAIPFESDFTLIGTTDRDYHGDPAGVTATAREIDYICASATRYFGKPVRPDDIVWSYAGVRPLYDKGDGAARAATRDYVLFLDDQNGKAPILSVLGGKITTYRRLAEHALRMLAPYLRQTGEEPGWTGRAPLPGGDFAFDAVATLVDDSLERWPFLDRETALRLVRAYGTTLRRILGDATSWGALGRDFGGGLSQAEVDHLVRTEWARSADDIVWRRTKLGLRMTAAQIAALDDYLSRMPALQDG